MPTKHVSEKTWEMVEKQTYQAVIKTGVPIKDTDMLHYLIRKGVESMNAEDYEALAQRRRRR